MEDEIKEILDNFKDYELRYTQCNENQFIIFYRDIHILLDYITNLQKTNKNLKGCIEDTNINYKNIITNLEEELKSANESISWWQNRFNAVEKENERLKEENKRIFSKVNDDELLISNGMNYAEAQKYKSKCDKALDKLYCYGEVFDSKILQQFQKEMENILQGGDE